MATATQKLRAVPTRALASSETAIEERQQSPVVGRARTAAQLSGAFAISSGIFVLVGWLLDIPYLRALAPGFVETQAAAAVAFLALGASLLLTISAPRGQRRLAARLLASVALVIGALTIAEYLVGHNLGIDQLLLHAARPAVPVQPTRIAPATAADLVCLGFALLLLNTAGGPKRRLVAFIAGAALVIALFTGIGVGVSGLGGVGGSAAAPFLTAITIVVLSTGIAAAVPVCILSEVLTRGGPGGIVLMRLLPTCIIVFPVFALLVFEGKQHRLYSTADGVAVFTLVSTVALAVVALSLARRLNRLDVERRRAAAKAVRLAALVDASSEPIMSSDAHGIILSCNPALEHLYGYTEAELTGRPVSFLTPPNKHAEQQRLMQAAARGAVATERDTQRVHRDGSLLEVSVTLSRIMEAGVFKGYCAVTHDIARRVQVHHDLEDVAALRTQELSRSRAETLHSLALAAEYRDYETAEHTERVGAGAARLATRLGLSQEFVGLIREAAPLHDVGKIGIPDSILLKPSALTTEEFNAMKEHTILGSRLLTRSGNKVLQLGESIALTHHERWDGGGYPAGLAGDAIPIAGQIVAVVDSFDAMTHDRPYRLACSAEDAIAEIERCSGTQFEPRVAEAFVELQHEASANDSTRPPLQVARGDRLRPTVVGIA